MVGVYYNFSAKINAETKDEIDAAFRNPAVVKHFNEFLSFLGLKNFRVTDISITDNSIKSKK